MPSMLIADDDLHLRKLVLTYAQMENYQCREAENGEQALAMLREAEADNYYFGCHDAGKGRL